MENQRQIFDILSRYYRSEPGQLIVRPAPFFTPAIVSGARIMVPKPFFQSWQTAIPKAALTHENTFHAFHTTILLAGPLSEQVCQFWDGGGSFLSNVPPGTQHRLCGYADLSFTVVLSDKVLFDLRPLLEDAGMKLAAEREEDERLRGMILKARAQATGHSPPDVYKL
jgi:hypothetical protein